MNDHRWTRVDALFDAALALPVEVRAAFLDGQCPADPTCRADVEELLRLATEPSPLLQPAALAPELLRAVLGQTDLLPRGTLTIDERVGVWRVLREIGRGGMGTVYLVGRADGQFDQKGALKLVRAALGSDEIALRLRRERRILASLTHANIARLLDGGQTEDGRPFLVTEYVEGHPIDRYCDDQRLTIDQRLDLFLRVCSGVQHAHRKLVVHRDIKPSNIMVAADGDVKLLDFGIARLLTATDGDEDALTQPVMRILTPEYASPEQVRGEPVAIASDVYQLGLLLYELLTGHKAQTIGGTSPAAMEQAICAATPVRPSVRVAASPDVAAARGLSPAALVRKLSGDLDTIVLCAVRKEPDRRYASVGELSADVERYRMGMPVRAQIDSFGYRARKFVARRRTALIWSAAFLVIAATALPAIVSERLRTAREAARAEQVETLLADMFAFANPRAAAQPPKAVHYVDHAASLVRSELEGEPRSQSRLLMVIGEVYNALGYYEASIRAVEQSLALRRAMFGDDSLDVAVALEALGAGEHYAARYTEAEANLREALRIRLQRQGSNDPDTIGTMIELGDLLHTRGRLLEAEQVLRDAAGTVRNAGQTKPLDAFERDLLARAQRDLANVLRDRGLFGESATLYRDAISVFREIHGEPNQQVAASQSYFARLLVMQSEFDDAENMLEHAVGVLRRIYDGEHPLVATALRELGYLRIEQGRFTEAETVLNEAQRIQQQLLGSRHSLVPRTRAHQAELARRRGRTSSAVLLARQTLEEFDRLGMPDHPSAIDARTTLGEALIALGQHDAAARELRHALSSAERQYVRGDRRIARLRDALARAGGGGRP
jgi:serine/threonine protein kinase/tetratricopeptide (TPR) repeat protein